MVQQRARGRGQVAEFPMPIHLWDPYADNVTTGPGGCPGIHVSEWIADTEMLTAEQVGAASLIVLETWKRRAPYAVDNEELLNLLKVRAHRWKKRILPGILHLFDTSGGTLVPLPKYIDGKLY
jgi:hypothetical protein